MAWYFGGPQDPDLKLIFYVRFLQNQVFFESETYTINHQFEDIRIIECQVLKQGKEEFALGDFSDTSALKGAVGKELLPSTSFKCWGIQEVPKANTSPNCTKQSSLHTRNLHT
jgi:hypothetical protein